MRRCERLGLVCSTDDVSSQSATSERPQARQNGGAEGAGNVDFRRAGPGEQAATRGASDVSSHHSAPTSFPQFPDFRYGPSGHPQSTPGQSVRTWASGGVALPPAPSSNFQNFGQPGWAGAPSPNPAMYQTASGPGSYQQPATSGGNVYSGVQPLDYAAGTPRVPRQMSNGSQGAGMSLRIPSNHGTGFNTARMVTPTPLSGIGDIGQNSGPRVDRVASFDSTPAMLPVNSPRGISLSDQLLSSSVVGGSAVLSLPGLPGVPMDASLPIRLCNAVQGQTHADAALVPQGTPTPPEESSSGAAPKGPPPAAALLTNMALCGMTGDSSLPMAAKLPQLAAKLDQAVAGRDGHSLAAMATGRGVTLPLRLCASHSSQLSKLNNELVRQAYTGDSSTASPELKAILAHVWDGVHLTLVGFVATVIAIRMGATEVAVPPSFVVFDFPSLHISSTGHSAQFLSHKQRGSKLVGLNRVPLQAVLSKCSQLAFIASSLTPQVAAAMEAFFQNVVDGNSSVGLTSEVFSSYQLFLAKLNTPAVLDIPPSAVAAQSMVMTPLWSQLLGVERNTSAELARIAAHSGAAAGGASTADLITHHDVSLSGLVLARLHALSTGSNATSSVVVMLRQRVDAPGTHAAGVSPRVGGAAASSWTYQPFLAVESRFDEYLATGELLCSVRYVSDLVQSSRHLSKAQATGQGMLAQQAGTALLSQEPLPRLVKQLSWMRRSAPAVTLWRAMDLSLRRVLLLLLLDAAAPADTSMHASGGGSANPVRQMVVAAMGVSGVRQLASILQQEQRKPLMLYSDAGASAVA